MTYPHITESEMRVTLAENLVYLRKTYHKNLSQRALARILHLSPKMITNYENAKAEPLAFAVFRLAAFYGCRMEKLLTENLKERTNGL